MDVFAKINGRLDFISTTVNAQTIGSEDMKLNCMTKRHTFGKTYSHVREVQILKMYE